MRVDVVGVDGAERAQGTTTTALTPLQRFELHHDKQTHRLTSAVSPRNTHTVFPILPPRPRLRPFWLYSLPD